MKIEMLNIARYTSSYSGQHAIEPPLNATTLHKQTPSMSGCYCCYYDSSKAVYDFIPISRSRFDYIDDGCEEKRNKTFIFIFPVSI